MGIENPVGDRKTDLYERYRVDQLEYEKRDREGKFVQKFSEKRPFFLIGLLQYLYRKVLQILSLNTKIDCKNLYALLRVLQILEKEDRSQDSEFLSDFSFLWEKIHEDALVLRKKTTAYSAFRKWILKIDSYPEGAEYSLGYYLSRQAGGKWFPFPYMELVQKLHRQHQKNPTSSFLVQWTLALEALIDLLQHD